MTSPSHRVRSEPIVITGFLVMVSVIVEVSSAHAAIPNAVKVKSTEPVSLSSEPGI